MKPHYDWYKKDCNCKDCIAYREGRLSDDSQIVTPEHYIKNIKVKKNIGKWGTAIPNWKQK